MMRIQCFDYLGWPVELILGRPVTNLIRRLLHTRGVRISIGSAPSVLSYTSSVGTGGVAQGSATDRAPSRPAPRLPADTHLRKP